MSPQYPTLRLLERHGAWLAALVALTPLVAAVIALVAGYSPWWLLAGVAAGAVLFLAARSYVEMIRLMTDMLLPK
jgi:type IV secretory pathway VirB2 component (pilin)